GYDGPEILPSSTRLFCLIGADAGQFDRVGPHSPAQAKTADELAVIDGEAPEGRFGHPRPAAIFGDVAQERFAHSTTLERYQPRKSGMREVACKPQCCPLA